MTEEPGPLRVLFLCTHNSSRSQMAEGLLRARGGGNFAALSAGTHPRAVHPLAIAVMREIGIDISPAMLARAGRRRKSATAEVELRQMDVTRLDFADRTFDGAVATFLFCVLPDELQVPALKELGRVVKAGGPVRALEYVRPHQTIRRILARLWEPWIAWAYGASFDRRTEEHVPEAGLALVDACFVVDDLVRLISARVAS